MNKISDKIYLGNYESAKNEEILKQNNINRVISCLGHLSPKYKNKLIKRKIFNIVDNPSTNIIKYFIESIKFIEESDDKVLVHCSAGLSRSASLVIAYFMWKNKLTYKESFEFVKKNRFIGPNVGFVKQLLIFEEQLKKVNYDLEQLNLDNFVWTGIKKNS